MVAQKVDHFLVRNQILVVQQQANGQVLVDLHQLHYLLLHIGEQLVPFNYSENGLISDQQICLDGVVVFSEGRNEVMNMGSVIRKHRHCKSKEASALSR